VAVEDRRVLHRHHRAARSVAASLARLARPRGPACAAPLFAAVLLLLLAPAPAAARPHWLRPVGGEILRGYSFSAADRFARGWHRGVTFAAPAGADVRAPCGGRVSWAGAVGSAGTGLTIECGRLNATLTQLTAALVRRGDVAAPGQVVGRASGEVQLGARVRTEPVGYLDPMAFIRGPRGPILGPAPSPEPTRRTPMSPDPARVPAAHPAPTSRPVDKPFLDLPNPGPKGALGIGMVVAALIMRFLRMLTPAARKGLAQRAARLVAARRAR
jgi:hypothetical protein